MSDWETCGACEMSEGKCALNDNECCDRCTHTFDGGETRKVACERCPAVFSTNVSGPKPKLCLSCYRAVNGSNPSRDYPHRVYTEGGRSREDTAEPAEHEAWYSSTSGIAHYWLSGYRRSACGLSRVRGSLAHAEQPECDKCKMSVPYKTRSSHGEGQEESAACSA